MSVASVCDLFSDHAVLLLCGPISAVSEIHAGLFFAMFIEHSLTIMWIK